ncbi:hypothetical protein DID88_002027 [Monilinia fructigena]|uniref:t-SNARE coiled-coil homology domain-containing protein n=1 Tax=Monilinia fructigena TaxID=38457 RepID=A0A395IYR2_9HELO|nr:hypothetical protein DID88_002027 [Monilinia fructigena]
MSFDQLSSLESQPTTMRREDDPQYADDPEFQRLSQDLMTKLFSLTGNISRLSNEISLLGTKRDTERVRERVHDLLEDSKDTFKEVGDGVKKIQSWEDVSPSQKYTQTKLAREFQNNLTEFQNVQRRALEKQRSSATAARTAMEEAQSPGAEGSHQFGQQQSQEQLRLASQDEVDFQDSLIVEREAEIRNIEQGVTELNELFRDVAHIVNEQGESLDTIANNVENVHSDTRGADLELRSAARYQKNARRLFKSRKDIQNAIAAASQAGPEYIELFNQISFHVCETILHQTSEPASKKRRIDVSGVLTGPNGTSNSAGSAPATGDDPVLLEIKEISVVIPQRKKYALCFTSTHLYARLPTSEEPVSGMSYSWRDIEYVFCLPVPEKAQKQYNYILFPKNSIITPSKPSPAAPPMPESLVFTITDGAPKAGTVGGTDSSTASAVSDDYKTLFNWALTTRLKAAVPGGEELTEEMEFQMIDQEDFAGINEFVQRHGLQDKSMAEQRKAKRLNVNVMKDEDGNVAAMDEEDEDEEDYDPGSEGESEGSGTSDSEEDDDENGEGGGAEDEEGEGDGEEEEL